MHKRIRDNNGRFARESTFARIAKDILFIILIIPFLYYLFIRKKLFEVIEKILDKEFGCHCPNSCRNGENGKEFE